MQLRYVSVIPAAVIAVTGVASSVASGAFPASVELSLLDGSDGLVLNGIDRDDFSGRAVARAGDVNGDGLDDVLIGARNADPNFNNSAGETYVVFGGSIAGASLDLSALNGQNGFVINGIDGADFSGTSVACAGDVNGDGYDDVIIGARSADPNATLLAGESYVVFGGLNVGAAGFFDLSSLNGTNGFAINGIDAFDFSGTAVSGAGDLNGDGFDDVIIGAPYARPNGNDYAGESYVVFGKVDIGASGSVNLAALDGTNGFVINGVSAFDQSGRAVSAAGDVNGDGFDDVLIGAPYASPFANSAAGESYVIFGGSGVGAGGLLQLSALDGSGGFVITGIDAFDFSGRSIASAGDVNGDGFDDLVIGAYGADPNGNSGAGETSVVFGDSSIGSTGLVDLALLNGTDGFVINGVDPDDESGFSVSSAGDVDGDGFDDLIIGAYAAAPGGRTGAGESYVIFGGVGIGSTGAVELASLDGTIGFTINGVDPEDQSGKSVASAGDWNGDGVADIIIGADGADPNGVQFAGESYIVFGQDTSCPGDANADLVVDINDLNLVLGNFGNPGGPGDLNDDGAVDIIDLNTVLGNFGLMCK